MEILSNTKCALTFMILTILYFSKCSKATKSKELQTKSMIDNWKKEQYYELDPKLKKVQDWFTNGCKSPRLTTRNSKRVIRQEYRTLTWRQRYLFHACLKVMLESPAVLPFWDQNEYESFVTQHKFQFSPEAHGTPSFAPYHRALLYFFEKVIHSHPGCENVGLPYWDSTLDSFLPDPSMSAMFTGDTYMGTTHGEVKGDLFLKWQKVKIKSCQIYGETLHREMCSDPHQMIQDSMIDQFLNCKNYTACVYPHDKSFEEHHGLIHGCMKGHMGELMCAPYDPIFYLHHAFIDYIFEDWLIKYYPDVEKDDPTAAYPPDDDIEEYYNRGSQPMRPFDKSGYLVKDGMSRNFTRDFYWYAPRPHKCLKEKDCKSSLIWCDVEAQRCKAKAGEGGSCEGLPDKACHCRSDTHPKCSANKICECLAHGRKPMAILKTSLKKAASKPSKTFAPSSSVTPIISSSSSLSLTTNNSSSPPSLPSSILPYSPLLPTETQTSKLPLPLATLLLATLAPLPLTTLPLAPLPLKTQQQNCKEDKDCDDDQWCDGICKTKTPLGGQCGTQPDNTCSAIEIDSRYSKKLQICRKKLEDPRCLFGRCICRIKSFKCDPNSLSKCPRGLYCSSFLSICLKKSHLNERCDVTEAFNSCGYCKRGHNGVCLRRIGRCYCVRRRTWYHMKHDW